MASCPKACDLASGLSALRFTCPIAVSKCGPDALRGACIDLLVVDNNTPTGGSVAEHLGLLFVNLGSIPLDREALRAPALCSMDLPSGLDLSDFATHLLMACSRF